MLHEEELDVEDLADEEEEEDEEEDDGDENSGGFGADEDDEELEAEDYDPTFKTGGVPWYAPARVVAALVKRSVLYSSLHRNGCA